MELFKSLFKNLNNNTDSVGQDGHSKINPIYETQYQLNPKLKALIDSIKVEVNPERPLLRKGYDKVSGMKCIDFSNWIIEQLEENDFDALWALVDELYTQAFIESFGIALQPNEKFDHIELKVSLKSFLSIDFTNYLNVCEKAFNEIKAFYIINYGMGKSDRDFWIVNAEKTIYLSKLLSIYSFDIKINSFKDLKKQTNLFIKSMKKEGAWAEYPYYKNTSLKKNYRIKCKTDLLDILKKLSISERFHLFDYAKHMNETSYWLADSYYLTKRYGINEEESIQHLIKLNLFEKVNELESIPQIASKAHIKELAEKEGFEIKKSWTLEKIYNNLITSEKGKKFLIDYSTNIGVYKFNSYYKEDLISILAYANELVLIADLLTRIG